MVAPKWAPKNDQEEEKMALGILKITMQYCCVLKQEENKNYKVVYFLSNHDMSFLDNDSISFWGQAHWVCSIYITNLYCFERNGNPFFQHKNSSRIFLTLIECTSKPEGPF